MYEKTMAGSIFGGKLFFRAHTWGEGGPPREKGTKNTKMDPQKKALILETGQKTVAIEAGALQDLADSLDGAFVEAVEVILEMPGRLVVTGIGKSAIVAQKIVATLNSTGTPSLFMHAADAIHGDLGMIRQEDVVLCLSKSGETPEIRVLIPLLRHRVHRFIGMVSHPGSYLATHADLVLLTPVSQEADPNNLAPTTSTTVQMAMGDALATALLALRGFSPLDFARYHPGGALGKQLYLRVSDLYPHNERPCVARDAGIREAILEMTTKRLGATAVVDEGERLLGIITDGDLRRMLERYPDTSGLRAADIMTPAPRSVEPDTLAVKALEILRTANITQLPVCRDGHYLGMIHLHDLLREGIV
jgi:arabinose-5-phosphate isomerase